MKVAMKQFGTVTALSLLLLTGAAFAQDEAVVTEETSEEAVAEEEGGWFSGITGWFSGLFGGSDDDAGDSAAAESVEEAESSAAPTGGTDWYGGASVGVTKYEENSLSTSTGFKAYGGAILSNRIGFEAAYMDFGDSDIKGAPGSLAADGFRGLVTVSTGAEGADSPVRLGLGYYSLDASVGSFSESSSGLAAAVNFEKAVTDRLYLTLGVDFYFGAKASGVRSDALVFGLGLAFHTSRPGVAEVPEGESVEVSEPAAESEAPAAEAVTPAEEPAVEDPAPIDEPAATEEPAVEEPAP